MSAERRRSEASALPHATEVTNPGGWMAHCHIAEHHEGGMMLSFTVEG